MIAIANGKVMTLTGGTLARGTMLVQDGRIAVVGKNVEIPADAQVYDAAGKVVMPGLIDAHWHVGIRADGIGGGHSDGNEMTDPIMPHLRALDAIHPEDPAFAELAAAGVTTVFTGPGSGHLIGSQGICLKTVPKPDIDQMILLEPAGMKIALSKNPKRAYGEHV